MIPVGSKAPRVTGKDQHAQTIDSDNYLGKYNVVLYFYPKNETKVCTIQACSFRDNYDDFSELNTKVIGISGDSLESHISFGENHDLKFSLLSDRDKTIRKAYQVPAAVLGLVPGRCTFLIDKDGEIVWNYKDMMDGGSHIEKALEQVKQIEHAV